MGWFTKKKNTENNAISKSGQANNNPIKGKPIQLLMQDKHEPFGNLSIDAIKATLMEEDFAQMQSLFFYMMRDLKIAAAVLTRRQQLIGQPFVLESDNEAFKLWVEKHVPLDDLISQVATSIYYGVSLTDVRYDVQDLQLVPQFNHISPRYIYANPIPTKLKTTLEQLYVRNDTKKIWLSKLEPDRMVFHKHAIDIGEVTDFSLASKLVWYFSIKHLTLAHNLAYFDNVATPPLIAKSGGNEDELIDTLYTLKSACVGVFDKDDVVEYLNVSSKADFLAFIEYIDRQIATLILGNSLSTGEGKNGSRAQSQVHENRQSEILRFDARLIQKTITVYLNRLEKLNFAHAKGITFRFDIKQEKNLLDLSGVVKNLSDSGFILDDADIQTQFGFKILGKKDATTQANNLRGKVLFGAASSEKRDLTPTVTPTDVCSCCHGIEHQAIKPYDALDQQVAAITTQSMENDLLKGVFSIIEASDTYEQAYQALLEAYPSMDVNKLESALFQSTANSHLLAVAEIEKGQ